MVKKIAINVCFGGFTLSKRARERCKELGIDAEYDSLVIRDDPRFIQVVEELGDEVSNCPGEIKICEIPDDVNDWYIHEYDGIEWICEGRTWGRTDRA